MFFQRKKSLEKYEAELKKVLDDIESHPVNVPEVKAASERIEELKQEGLSTEDINANLSANGLMRAEEVGKVMFQHILSYSRLQKRRRTLEARIEKRKK